LKKDESNTFKLYPKETYNFAYSNLVGPVPATENVIHSRNLQQKNIINCGA
jgi:hypothetical protein